MDIIPRLAYYVYMTDITPGDVTQQGTSNKAFYDDERKNPVAQVDTDGGPRDARMEIGPGFYTSPMPGERVQCLEEGEALYGIGGTNQAAMAEISPEQGERGVFVVNAAGEIAGIVKLKTDGTLRMENTSGDFEIQPDGTVLINGGNLKVLP